MEYNDPEKDAPGVACCLDLNRIGFKSGLTIDILIPRPSQLVHPLLESCLNKQWVFHLVSRSSCSERSRSCSGRSWLKVRHSVVDTIIPSIPPSIHPLNQPSLQASVRSLSDHSFIFVYDSCLPPFSEITVEWRANPQDTVVMNMG